MTQAVFDAALELKAAGAAVTTTTSTTGVNIQARFLPVCSWVIDVTAVDAANNDETYVFTLEVSDLVGGTYTKIAEHVWPRAHGPGKVHVPISADLATFQDTDSDWMHVTVTTNGTSPSITYTSYLTKATNKLGIAARPGDVVAIP